MDKEILAERFGRAHILAVSFARELVVQNLPEPTRFLLYPNQSYDGNPLVDDEETYPEERLPRDQYLGPLTEDEVVAWLWRSGKVPEWVNLSVAAEDDSFTYVELLCCGRFTAKGERLYHQREGYSPFHVLGPVLPPNWKDLKEKGDRFDLYWNGPKIIKPRWD